MTPKFVVSGKYQLPDYLENLLGNTSIDDIILSVDEYVEEGYADTTITIGTSKRFREQLKAKSFTHSGVGTILCHLFKNFKKDEAIQKLFDLFQILIPDQLSPPSAVYRNRLQILINNLSTYEFGNQTKIVLEETWTISCYKLINNAWVIQNLQPPPVFEGAEESQDIEPDERPYLNEYLSNLRTSFKNIELGQFFSIEIENIIPQNLICQTQGFIDPNRDILPGPINILAIIDRSWDIAIVSPAGMGKSTLLKSLVYQLASKDKTIPFFIDLSTADHNLKKILKHRLNAIGLNKTTLREYLILLIIDAVDEYEIKSRNRFKSLFEFKEQYNAQIIFSSRYSTPDLNQKKLPVFSLCPLDFNDIRKLFTRQFKELAETYLKIPGLEKADLIRRPLFLTFYMSLIVIEEKKQTLIDLKKMSNLLKNSAALLREVIVNHFLLNVEQKHISNNLSIDRWRSQKRRQIECVSFLALQTSLYHPGIEMIKECHLTKMLHSPIPFLSIAPDFNDLELGSLSEQMELHGILRYEDGKIGFTNKETRTFLSAYYLSICELDIWDSVQNLLESELSNNFYHYYFGLIDSSEIADNLFKDDESFDFQFTLKNSLLGIACVLSGNFQNDVSKPDLDALLRRIDEKVNQPANELPTTEKIELITMEVEFYSRLYFSHQSDFLFNLALQLVPFKHQNSKIKTLLLRVMKYGLDDSESSILISEKMRLELAAFYWCKVQTRFVDWIWDQDLEFDVRRFCQGVIIQHPNKFYDYIRKLIEDKKVTYDLSLARGLTYATYALAISYESNIRESLNELKYENQFLIAWAYLEILYSPNEQIIDSIDFSIVPTKAMLYAFGIFMRANVQLSLTTTIIVNLNQLISETLTGSYQHDRLLGFFVGVQCEFNFFYIIDHILMLNSPPEFTNREIEMLFCNINDIADRPNALTSAECRTKLNAYLNSPSFPEQAKEEIRYYAKRFSFKLD